MMRRNMRSEPPPLEPGSKAGEQFILGQAAPRGRGRKVIVERQPVPLRQPGHAGRVEGDKVHRHAPGERQCLPLETRAARSRMTAQIAVGIADVRDRDAAAPRRRPGRAITARLARSEEHTSELQSLLRIPYAPFSLKKKT